MRIRYEVTIADLIAYDDFACRQSAHLQRRRYWYRRGVALYILLAPSALVYLFKARTPVLPVFLGSLVAAMFFFLWYPGYLTRRRHRLIHKMAAEDGNKSMLGEAELELTENGLISRTDQIETKLAWESLQRIETTPNATYLYVNQVNACVVPHDKVIEGDFPTMLAEIGRRYHPDRELESVKETSHAGRS